MAEISTRSRREIKVKHIYTDHKNALKITDIQWAYVFGTEKVREVYMMFFKEKPRDGMPTLQATV